MRTRRTRLGILIAATTAVLAGGAAQAQTATPAQLEQARRILRTTPLIDGHNDLPWAIRDDFGGRVDRVDLTRDTRALTPPLQTDIPRLRQGGVGGQFWSVYVPAGLAGPQATKAVLEQIDIARQVVARHPEAFAWAETAEDVVRIHRSGRIASMLGAEGGYAIDNSLPVLRQLRRAGVRYMTLTHSATIDWADSATDAPRHGGLSPFGEAVVREMNRIGMLVDLSHVSPDTMRDAMRVSEAPVIFSHSSARGVTDHPRNIPDDVLRALKQDGGVAMVTFVAGFVSEPVRAWGAARTAEEARLKALHPGDPVRVATELAAWTSSNPAPRATVGDVADHLDHMRRVAGVDHVGIGGDFDGTTGLPVGLEGVEAYPVLLAELLRRGWSEADIRKLAGENVLRVLRAADQTAERLARTTPPSTARLTEAP
ncbi:MAG: dipeptidase [Proteobacteria bacterium]|nr:dipeptidase [Pseudomonadota bacterium]